MNKSETDFCKRTDSKDGLRAICKVCSRESSKISYRKNSKYYIAQKTMARKNLRDIIEREKNVPCKDCGITYPPYVMDFDHLRDKKFNISAEMHRVGVVQLKQEISKCDVVCSNCHRIRTHNRKMNFS
jgi:Zn finger protein HypA/HybF involved in hydrogenase expression